MHECHTEASMICRADEHYKVIRSNGPTDHILRLGCMRCPFSVDVKALHKAGDKSGAGRYCRARAKMVKHWHAEHAAPQRATASPYDCSGAALKEYPGE